MSTENRVLVWIQPELQIGSEPSNVFACLLFVVGPLMLKPFFRPFWWRLPGFTKNRPGASCAWCELVAGPFCMHAHWKHRNASAALAGGRSK